MPPGVNDRIRVPWDFDSPVPLYDFDERNRPTRSSKCWHPELMSFVGIHLFHHPDYESDSRVHEGKKSPAGWDNDVRHADLALVYDVEIDKKSPWMFKATVLVAGQVLTMGGKWLRPLEEFEEDR